MLLKKIIVIVAFTLFSLNVFANTPRSTGKYKNWESFVAETDKGKICFAQTIPTKRAPAAASNRERSQILLQERPKLVWYDEGDNEKRKRPLDSSKGKVREN